MPIRSVEHPVELPWAALAYEIAIAACAAYKQALGRYIGSFQTIPVGGTTSNEYLFHDQLGSLVRVTDVYGVVQDRIDYTAYGERRSATNPDASGLGSSSTRRGFTNHEHFGALGIIHMNGRVYDPGLGRFMQADPIIQAPHDRRDPGVPPKACARRACVRF